MTDNQNKNQMATEIQKNDLKLSSLTPEDETLWGAQTQLSLQNFNIGEHVFSSRFIDVLVSIKLYCAIVNHDYKLLNDDQYNAISYACDELSQGGYYHQFPLRIWQTGSGTQTNMNVNEVIASLANKYNHRINGGTAGDFLHPNDHVNMSQSSNDVFPTAMHIVVAKMTMEKLIPAIEIMENEFQNKEIEFKNLNTVGRTHLMDALPISSSALLLAHNSQILAAKKSIEESLIAVYQLALGGTAVGSGANAPTLFGKKVISLLAKQYQLPLVQHPNLYAAVSGEGALLRFSGALKELAATLFKVANDFRLLGSGPRCGLNEWRLPANEAGSSIMPGKVNPTQCEALSMVCLQVFGNDLTVSMASANGQLQLNTYRPVIIHNILESIDLLTDAMTSFSESAIHELALNHIQINTNMSRNLSVVTLLTPRLGYTVAAKIAKKANQDNISLADAAEALGLFSQYEFQHLIQEQLSIYFKSIETE